MMQRESNPQLPDFSKRMKRLLFVCEGQMTVTKIEEKQKMTKKGTCGHRQERRQREEENGGTMNAEALSPCALPQHRNYFWQVTQTISANKSNW
jgi:hypothetical protein